MTSLSFLSQVSLCSHLSSPDLQGLASCLTTIHCQAEDVIFRQNDPGDSLYIIEEGTISIVMTSTEGQNVTLAELGKGEFFGELAPLDAEPRSADAVAKEDSTLHILERSDFLRYLANHPEAAVGLLASLSNRLRTADQLGYETEFVKMQEWNGQLQTMVKEMTSMNQVFRDRLGQRFGMTYALREVRQGIEALASEAEGIAGEVKSESIKTLARNIRALAFDAEAKEGGFEGS